MPGILIKDGKIQIRGGKVLIEQGGGTDCLCYRQAFTCSDDTGVDFWALSTDLPEDGGTFVEEDSGECVYWGPKVLCLPEGATLGDVDDLSYFPNCDACGYVQAYRCSNNVAQDLWASAADATPGGFFADIDGVCMYWGAVQPTLGGTLVDLDTITTMGSCTACCNPPSSCPPGAPSTVTVSGRWEHDPALAPFYVNCSFSVTATAGLGACNWAWTYDGVNTCISAVSVFFETCRWKVNVTGIVSAPGGFPSRDAFKYDNLTTFLGSYKGGRLGSGTGKDAVQLRDVVVS